MNKSNRFFKILISSILVALILSSCSLDALFYEEEENVKTGNLIAHFLDVGQGDSTFIELPNGETMLIDASVSGLGEGIESYINDCGYSKIDYLVATHPHADHIGSMAYIVENLDIGKIYMPNVSTTTRTFEKLLTAISEKGMKIQSAKAGMNILDNSNLDIDILAPVKIIEDDLNNCSVVLKITYNNNSFLFTGDAEKVEFETINADMSADVLKVPHHGSRTSTNKEFLERVNPQIAVISLGKDNEYGHPHKSTLKYLKEFGVTTYRTDKDATVIVTSDGNDISVDTNGISIGE